MADNLTKYYEIAIQEGPCGPSEAIALVTTDRVDRDGEVVLPGGAVLDNYRRNPIVQYGHAKGLPSEGEVGLPVGTNLWIKPARDGHGLIAKHTFDTDDPFAARVCGKVKRGVLRTYSITFLPLEYGPPTAAEVKARPDWREAKTIYRKWELIEYSVVAMPSNVDAVTLAKRGKTMADEPEVAAEVATADETTPETEAAPEFVTKTGDIPAKGTERSAAYDPDHDGDDDSPGSDNNPDEAEDDAAPKRGDYVKCKGSHCKGYGVVQSVHKAELVPDVPDDIHGTHDDPGLRVRMHKKMGDGWVASSHYRGMHVSHVEKCDALKPPAKKGKTATVANADPEWTPAEKGAYVAARINDPAFLSRVERRVAELFDVKILGKV